MTGRVDNLLAIGRTVADLARTEAFHRDGLGFHRLGPIAPIPAAMLDALGSPDASGTRLRMGLGEQILEFLAFDAPGVPDPVGAGADDPRFQHAAIVVSDMDRAFAHLQRLGPVPISRGGPQVLPPSSGGVAAWKFRDPDGHPLELIAFPEGGGGRWADAPGLFAGIDHSAITVTDADAAIAFFRDGLGLHLTARGLNTGPEQAALDGLRDPVVDVIALAPSGAPTPHVELLRYRTASPPTAPLPVRDRAPSRFHVRVDDLTACLARLAATWPELSVTRSKDGRMAGLTGPDGHGLLLIEPEDDRGRPGATL